MRVVLLLSLVLFSVGYAGDEGMEKVAAVEAAETLEQAAEIVTERFQNDLKGELMAAMKEGGAVGAIEVCHTRAPEIAAAHSLEGVWSVARVTDKPRQPQHAVTDHQAGILAKVADTTTGERILTEWIVGEGGDSTFVYYRPIRIGGLCTGCHGPADKLAPRVAERLAELYPEDQATGYEAGDLRGMFVVTMAWPEAKEPAMRLVQEASVPAAEGE